MIESFGKRFFQALLAPAEVNLGADHPCVLAVARAATTGDMADTEAAQRELSKLPVELSATLMETVHKVMREDPGALLDIWGGRRNVRRPN